MAKVDPNLRQRVLALVARSSTGITAPELAAGVSLNPDDRQLLQCLNDLAAAGLVVSDGAANPHFIALGSVTGDTTATVTGSAGVPPALDRDAGQMRVSPPTPPPTSPTRRVAPRATSTTAPAPTAVAERVTPPPTATRSPAAPDVTPPAATDPDFAPMFDLAVPMVITALMTRSVAIAALRMQALRNQKAGRAMAEYVDYALARLDALTPADAPNIGITPDELLNWQQYFRG